MVVQADANGWISRQQAMEILGVKSKSTFYKLAEQLSVRREEGRVEYERTSVVGFAKARDQKPEPPQLDADEKWIPSSEAQTYVGQLTYYATTGELRRKESGEAGAQGRYLYALSDLKRLVAEKRPAKRKRKKPAAKPAGQAAKPSRGRGKKHKEREEQIELLTAQLAQQQPHVAEGDTRADIIAFAKRRVADTAHFHAIRIVRGEGERLIVEIELKKVDRYELGDP
jgi:hypothetical protein